MHVYTDKKIGSYFAISSSFPEEAIKNGKYLMLIWNDGPEEVSFVIDEMKIDLPPSSVVCATYLYNIRLEGAAEKLRTLYFNREFYCVHTNDSEVSSNGLLFFGSSDLPVLKLNEADSEKLRTLFGVLEQEFKISDTNQDEMLRILLKRFIICCTRLAREQFFEQSARQHEIDLVRRFHVLVEKNFRTHKHVADYAEMMFKSPITITNVFGQHSRETPLQVIHKRIIMEAKRLLMYTDKTAGEIGYELGYNDPAQFSKLFSKQTGTTTTEFRKSGLKAADGNN